MDRQSSAAETTAAGNPSPHPGPSPDPCPTPKAAAGTTLNVGPIFAQTARHFFPDLNTWLSAVPDPRFQPFVIYHRRFLLWWGLSLFLFKLTSRRQLDYQLNTDGAHVLDNLNRLAETKQTTRPVNKTLNCYLGRIGPQPVAGLRTQMVRRLLRMKVLEAARLQGRWVVVTDATGMLAFRERHCDHCLTQVHGETTVYMHQVLEAKLLGPADLVISLGTEFIDNRDAADTPAEAGAEQRKQDCELKALSRLAPNLKREFPQLPLCLSGDGLYACGRTLQIAKDNGWSYVLTFQPGRLPALWKEFQSLLTQCPDQVVELITPERVHQEYRWVDDLSYTDSEGRPWTFTGVQCVETFPDATTRTWAWITDRTVNHDTVVEVATKGGRHRWHIENQGFNTQKNSGLNLEHAYSHGEQQWPAYYYLLQIAHILLQLFEKGSLLLRLAATEGKKPLQMFGSLKNLGNRSVSSEQFRAGLTGTRGAKSIMQIVEHAFTLQSSRLHDGKDPLDEAAAGVADATETSPPPEDCPAQHPLHEVVGRLDAFDAREGPHCGFQLEQVLAKGYHGLFFAENPPFDEKLVHLVGNPIQVGLQFCSRRSPFLKGMPRGKDLFDDLQPSSADPDAGTGTINDLLKIAFQVGPANLATCRGNASVGSPTITAQDALDFRPQEGLQAQGAALAVNHERYHGRRGCRPQPAQLARQFPTGLIRVLDFCRPDRRQGFVVRRRQRGTYLLFQVGHRAQRHRSIEHGRGNLFDAAFADAVATGEIRQRRRQTRTNAVRHDVMGNGRVCHLATFGAGAEMALMFGHDRHHRRQFDGLETAGGRIVRGGLSRQWRGTVLALTRHVRHHVADAFDGYQLFQARRMSRLTTTLSLRLLLDDGLRRPQGIGGRWYRRVGGVDAQPRRQVADERLQFGDAPFQRSDASVPLATSWACGDFHDSRLHGRSLRSCASFSDFR
jgi:hypothetical protein